MVDDKEGEAVEVEFEPDALKTLHAMASYVEQGLVALGVDVNAAKHFACLRFHPLHPWGVAFVKYQGAMRLAIVQSSADGQQLFVFALLTAQGDEITGPTGVPIDKDGCMPLSAFPIAPATKH